MRGCIAFVNLARKRLAKENILFCNACYQWFKQTNSISASFECYQTMAHLYLYTLVQVRQLSFSGHLDLRGTSINVMVANVAWSQSILPQVHDLEGSVLVSIKRKLSYTHMSGIICHLCTITTLVGFLKSSLYIANGVVLNE